MKKKYISTLKGIFGVAFLIAGAFAFGGSVEGGIIALILLFVVYLLHKIEGKEKKKR